MKPDLTPEEKKAKRYKTLRTAALNSIGNLHWVLGNFAEYMGVSDKGVLPIGGTLPPMTYHADGITVFSSRHIHAFMYWGRKPYTIGVLLYEIIKDPNSDHTYYRDLYHTICDFGNGYVSGGGFYNRTKKMDAEFEKYIDTYTEPKSVTDALMFDNEADAAFWFVCWETESERKQRYAKRKGVTK